MIRSGDFLFKKGIKVQIQTAIMDKFKGYAKGRLVVKSTCDEDLNCEILDRNNSKGFKKVTETGFKEEVLSKSQDAVKSKILLHPDFFITEEHYCFYG